MTPAIFAVLLRRFTTVPFLNAQLMSSLKKQTGQILLHINYTNILFKCNVCITVVDRSLKLLFS